MAKNGLILKISASNYELIKKYSPESISELKQSEAGEYSIDNDAFNDLLENLDDAVVRYGLNKNQDNVTPLGQELTLLFDNLYNQS